MTQPFIVFRARKILTINPTQPTASYVAIKDGKIAAIGTRDDLHDWGKFDLDERFADKILMPGLIEAHSHVHEGGLWQFPYVGYFDRRGPDGTLWKGLRSFDEVISRLADANAKLLDPSVPLLAWGFDPIYFSTSPMTTRELDRVSVTRSIAILHASFHLMNVNTAMLAKAGITRDTQIEGVTCFPDGNPTGELREFAAMFPVHRAIGNGFRAAGQTREGLWNFGRVAQLAGVTTATDLSNELLDDGVDALIGATGDRRFPVRLVPAFRALTAASAKQDAQRVVMMRNRSTEKLRFGAVKLIIDGSIQGFTARLRWPGYHNGSPNGLWVIPPSEIPAIVENFHSTGLQIHIHTNGDEATQVALDAIEHALTKCPRRDHRHTLHHCQMADAAQFRRMASLGVCVNLFSNHIYYWGDVHYAQTMGPDRANRMNASATALRFGVPFAIHSDAPITPIGPLFTAWCAVNRCTASGRVLGRAERI